MITVAAVQVGDYLGRGREYVENLFDGVRRHLTVPWRGVCLTDDPATIPDRIEPRAVPPGLVGWWNKNALFQPGMFDPGERVLYLDLDTIVRGNIDAVAAYRGPFAIMSDVFFPEHYGSAVMAWEAGKVDHIWTTWDMGGRPSFHRNGDQRWVEAMVPNADRWQDMLPGHFVSYKKDCMFQGGPPDAARLIIFHGLPRPHEVETRWVKDLWERT